MVDELPNNAMERSARELTQDAPRLIAHVRQRKRRAEVEPQMEPLVVFVLQFLWFVRLVGRRRTDAHLDEPIVSISSRYAKKPLLRNSE